jgi:hypothetical protein
MRIILIAALFLLPISAVAAKPLHNLVPDATHHHKAGLDVHQMHKDTNIHEMPHQHFHDRSLVFHHND